MHYVLFDVVCNVISAECVDVHQTYDQIQCTFRNSFSFYLFEPKFLLQFETLTKCHACIIKADTISFFFNIFYIFFFRENKA